MPSKPISQNKFCRPLVPSRVDRHIYDTTKCPVNPATLQCSVCLEISDQPLLLHCRSLMCSHCLCTRIKGYTDDYVLCPCCHTNERLVVANVQAPPEAIQHLIASLPVVCEMCHKSVRAREMQKHLSSGCEQHIYIPPITLQHAASLPLSTPVHLLELQAVGIIIRHYQYSNSSTSEETTITIPSGNQGGKV